MAWERPPHSLCIPPGKWQPNESGLADNLFVNPDHETGDQINIIKSLSSSPDPKETPCQLTWMDGRGRRYTMELLWDGEKLHGENITICVVSDSGPPQPVYTGLNVTILPLLGAPMWSGTLHKLHGNEGNGGVFVAREDPPYGPKEESRRSAGVETSTTV